MANSVDSSARFRIKCSSLRICLKNWQPQVATDVILNNRQFFKIMNATLQLSLALTTTLGLTSVGVITSPQPAASQITPQPWGSLGVEDDEISYSLGARWFDFGVELGGREDGATGVDVLKFVSFPVVSPYLGLGLYADAEDDIAISGGVQVHPPGDIFVGAGYHSVRGINGQLGIKF